jgi:endonuclease YncB( thermonuclease family)
VIRDGDTFEISGTAVRLCGVDAPERNEPGWRAAVEAVREITAGRTVRCVQVGDGTVCDGRSRPTNYDRIVAQCFVGSTDLAAHLAEAGLACDWTAFSGGYYSVDGKGQPCP